MAYPSEHSARQEDPSAFVAFRRVNDEMGPGRDVVYGIRPSSGPQGGFTEIQSIRFDARIHSAEEARQWLQNNDFDTARFIAAPGRKNPSRGEMISGMLDAADRYSAGDRIGPDTKKRLNALAKEIKKKQDGELEAEPPREERAALFGFLGGGLEGMPTIRKEARPGFDQLLRYATAAGISLVIIQSVGNLTNLQSIEIPDYIRNAM